jgi:hypothetical protein
MSRRAVACRASIALLGAVTAWSSQAQQTNVLAAGSSAATNAAAVAVVRDPFWPVGYTPPPPPKPGEEKKAVEPEEAPEVAKPLDWPTLELKALARSSDGRRYMAVISGVGLIESGETVTVIRDGVRYRWVIVEINERGMRQRRLDATAVK